MMAGLMAIGEHPLSMESEREWFYRGMDLFNQHRFFDAHEAWEEVWKQVYGRHKLFYQGLIQCAVALEHLRRGNLRGARVLFRTCQTKFAPLPRVYMGLEIWSLIGAMARTLTAANERGEVAATVPEETWPTITLSCDPFATGEAEQRRRE
jgi:uncharacterized protein